MRLHHFFLCFLLISPLGLFSQEQKQWAQTWAEGLDHYHKKEFRVAAEKYTAALKGTDNTDIAPYIRFDRAKAHNFSGQLKQAIEDFTYVIEHSNPATQRFQTALIGRSVAYAMSGEMEKSKADTKRLDQEAPVPLASTDNAGYRVIDAGSAIGFDDVARNAYINSLILMGLCESEEDVIFSPSGIILVKLRKASQ